MSKRKTVKKMLTLAIALVITLALIPLSATASEKQIIENTFAEAATISVGQKVTLGAKQTAPTKESHHIYYNIDSKFKFTITETSEVTFTLSTETTPSDYRDNSISLRIYAADGKTEMHVFNGRWVHSINVTSDEAILAKDYSVKLVPGTYYTNLFFNGACNSYGWVEYKASVPMQDDHNGEPNDTLMLALAKSSLSTEVEYKGNINYWGNESGGKYGKDGEDYYRFDVPSDGYSFKLTASRADAFRSNYVTIRLLNSTGSRIGDTLDLTTSPTGEVEYKNLNAGTYFINFYSGFADSYETEYTFKLIGAAGSTASQQPSQPTKTDISILCDGIPVTAEVPPFIDANGRTMVPVRFVSEALGANVGWEPATRTVTITKTTTIIILQINSRLITSNGVHTTMDTTAIIKDSRTFVPVRYIAEALGLDVDWDGVTRTVILTTS